MLPIQNNLPEYLFLEIGDFVVKSTTYYSRVGISPSIPSKTYGRLIEIIGDIEEYRRTFNLRNTTISSIGYSNSSYGSVSINNCYSGSPISGNIFNCSVLGGSRTNATYTPISGGYNPCVNITSNSYIQSNPQVQYVLETYDFIKHTGHPSDFSFDRQATRDHRLGIILND